MCQACSWTACRGCGERLGPPTHSLSSQGFQSPNKGSFGLLTPPRGLSKQKHPQQRGPQVVNPVPRGLCRLQLEPELEKPTQGSWSTAGCPGQAPPLSGLQPSHLQRVPPALATRPAAITPASEKSRGAMGTVAWPPSTHTPGQGTHLAAPLHSHATTQWPQDKFASLHLRAAVLSRP